MLLNWAEQELSAIVHNWLQQIMEVVRSQIRDISEAMTCIWIYKFALSDSALLQLQHTYRGIKTGTAWLFCVSEYKAFPGNPQHKQQQQKARCSQEPRPN